MSESKDSDISTDIILKVQEFCTSNNLDTALEDFARDHAGS
jgi:hypothetical protein